MKKLLFIMLSSLSIWGCQISDGSHEYVRNADMTYLRAKTIYKVLAATNGQELNILFTDSTAVTIYSSDCWLIIRKYEK